METLAFKRNCFVRIWLCPLVMFGLCLGCSSKADQPVHARVQGIVTLNGKPLDTGVIRFIPQAPGIGPPVSAAISEGKFEMPAANGPFVGTHRVEVERKTEAAPDPEDMEAVRKFVEAQKKARKEQLKIPARYNSQSELIAEVGRNSPNDFRFELTAK